MRWRRLEQSDNVDDRRGRTAKVAGGVGGLGIIGVLGALFLGGFGGDGGGLGDLLSGLQQVPEAAAPQEDASEFEGIDDEEAFVRSGSIDPS